MTADTSEQVDNAMVLLRFRKAEGTQRQAQLVDELLEALGVGVVRDNSQETKSQQTLSLFASEPNWSSQAIRWTIKNVSETMRIDASPSVEVDTYNTIEAMVSSQMIFHG